MNDFVEYAQYVKNGSRNGMSTDGRVLAEIPMDLYNGIERHLKAMGDDSRPKAVIKVIERDFKQFLTVNALDTGSKGQIRV